MYEVKHKAATLWNSCLTSDYGVKLYLNNEGIYQDAAGDAFEFIDLTKLKITVDDEKIAVYISLTYIPHLLVFDWADITDDILEYEWSVSFDVNGDGTPANDISFSLSPYKFARDKVSIDGILSFTQHE